MLLHWVAKELDTVNAVAATFIYPKELTREDFLRSFLATVLLQIGKYLPSFEEALQTVLSDERLKLENVLEEHMALQVQQLLYSAWSEMSARDQERPLLIILDGVERCMGYGVERTIEFIKACVERIPGAYFIISSSSDTADTCRVGHVLKGESLEKLVHEVYVEDYLTVLAEHESKYVPEKAVDLQSPSVSGVDAQHNMQEVTRDVMDLKISTAAVSTRREVEGQVVPGHRDVSRDHNMAAQHIGVRPLDQLPGHDSTEIATVEHKLHLEPSRDRSGGKPKEVAYNKHPVSPTRATFSVAIFPHDTLTSFSPPGFPV